VRQRDVLLLHSDGLSPNTMDFDSLRF